MHVLVTGGGGFLGRYIVEQLQARGDRVRSFGRGSYPDLAATGVEVVQGDLRREADVLAAVDGVDAVVHTAAVAGIWGPWDYFHGINTRGTEHVVRACQASGVSILVYTSSPSVTFDGIDQRNVDESVPYPSRWLCHYPHTKALGEQVVLAANDRNLRTCSLRPHLIWGPRDTHLVPRLMDRARRGQLRQVGTGRNLVDMIYVENAAQAHVLALDALRTDGSAAAGKAYFLSQGQPVNCWDWINAILALDGIPPVQRAISRSAAERVGGILEFVWKVFGWQSEPRMTRFLAAQLATDHFFDISAARQDLGYAPHVPTEEGMRRLQAALKRDAATLAQSGDVSTLPR